MPNAPLPLTRGEGFCDCRGRMHGMRAGVERILCAILLSLILGCGSGAELIRPEPPHGITETLEILHDDSRRRLVPIKVYAPARDSGQLPVILFSHGLGSSRQGYVFLGREWAARGYVSVHVQHVASDSEVLRRRGYLAIYRAAYDEVEYGNRPADLSFVLDVLERRKAGSEQGSIWSRLDLSRVGVAGHSYGAHTALTLAGMLVNYPESPGTSAKDPRFRAALVLSAPTMEWSPGEKEFAPITIPTMHMTGTKDTSRIWRTSLMHRRRAFDTIRNAPRYFLNIDGATHQTFADLESIAIAKKNGRLDVAEPPLMKERSEEHQRRIDLIVEYSAAFWDAWLRDSGKAREWLETAEPRSAEFERRD